MEALEQAVKHTPSGPALLKQLTHVSEHKDQLARLICKVVGEVQARQEKANGAKPAGKQIPSGKVFCTTELQCLAPRGKFTVSFAENVLGLSGARVSLQAEWPAIKAVAIIDNIPKDTKGRVLLFLHLGADGAVQHGKQMLEALVIQTLAADVLDLPAPGGQGRLQGPAPVVLCQALGMSKQPHGLSFSSPSPDVFQSASGAMAVDAVVKVSQGHLYPLSDALCFLEKPALFFPLTEIASVELCRAGGMFSTFDLLVHGKSGHTQEFSNLPKAELGPISQYIASRGLRSGSKENATATQHAQEDAGDSSEEDSDFDPDREDGEEANGTASGHHRSAANATQASAAEDGDASEDLEAEDDEQDEEESDDDGEVSLVSESLSSDEEEEEEHEEVAAAHLPKKQRVG